MPHWESITALSCSCFINEASLCIVLFQWIFSILTLFPKFYVFGHFFHFLLLYAKHPFVSLFRFCQWRTTIKDLTRITHILFLCMLNIILVWTSWIHIYFLFSHYSKASKWLSADHVLEKNSSVCNPFRKVILSSWVHFRLKPYDIPASFQPF